LDDDIINPIEAAGRLNTFWWIETIIHLCFTFLLLVTRNWFELFVNLPLAAFNVHSYNIIEMFLSPLRADYHQTQHKQKLLLLF
jgi:hypothetical protein